MSVRSVVLALVIGVSAPSRAQGDSGAVEPTKPAPARIEPNPTRTIRVGGGWYGWQLLPIDAALLTAYFAIGRERSEFSTDAAVYAGFVIAAPLVHLAHGSPYVERAGGSIVMRLIAPLTLGLTFGLVGTDRTQRRADQSLLVDGFGKWAAIGFEVGMVFAALGDAFIVAWHPERAVAVPASSSTTLVPAFGPPRVGLAWIGRF